MVALLIILGLAVGTTAIEAPKANKNMYILTPLQTQKNITTYSMEPIKSGKHRIISSDQNLPDTLNYADFKNLKSEDNVEVLKRKEIKEIEHLIK